jgi:hypothetical protein
LSPNITFSLRHISFNRIYEHARKNSNIIIPEIYSNYKWIYLSNFYSSSTTQRGLATKVLQDALSVITTPYILCCEPILGTNERSITERNIDLTADERYKVLCEYYEKKFKLVNEIPTRCTLKTEIVGHGKVWSDLDRKFLWGIQNMK